ncbi:HAD family hydrolase [Jannaschia sp. Os4]|uniref:HAD family hydrolase n=1 Tax=Jannaschia sp. Os4 TaxID=2807617 RepID=UPI0019395A6B|nr:HAD family hydrolase [Jannaschia sp. Os4]MBM2577895.1 HAD family hydrolase [Jannaschia sp. Os4]
MIRAILFDKDGTLTDFRATWTDWLRDAVHALADDAGTAPQAVAEALGYDLARDRIDDHGPFVTQSNAQHVQRLAPRVGWSADRLAEWVEDRARAVEQVRVPGADAALAALHADGWTMGILTNATTAEAAHHLGHMGLRDLFVRIVGYDVAGPKPDPAGALTFARERRLDPSEILVVGDGMTDMEAARRAGMPAVGVLTGTLSRADLEPHARAVLDDVTALPGWLSANA